MAQPKTDIVNTLVQTVKQDVEILEKSGQWIFSSYSPAKECASIPGIGLDDISPEEMRFEAYTAKYNNTLPAFEQSVQGLVQAYANIRRQLLNPTPSLKEALRKIYKDESSTVGTKSVFGGSNTFGQQSSGLFGASSNNSNNNAGSGSSLFGGNSFSSSSQGFGNQSNIPSKSIFGGSVSSMTQNSSSIFGGGGGGTASPQQAQQGGSIFGGGPPQPQQVNSVFGAPASVGSSSNPFASFQQKPSQQQSSSIFGTQQSSPQTNVFGSVQPQQQQVQQTPGRSSNNNNNNSSIFKNDATSLNMGAVSSEAEGMNDETIEEFQTPESLASRTIPNTTTSNPVPNNNNNNSSNIFQTPQELPKSEVKTGLFGQIIRKAEDPSLYSKIEILTREELEIFKTKNFVLGKIPEIPPPRELCT
ncbi:NUPL2 [Lepeophtheirus salmonis]|uniref:NUPL2 n=1 Tax=Lepeophtheirus salmonis TaxID=72036 RepID=A0A7R8CZB2_LEPSM|nr:NUPL2 [Lepeophtheirus salmonis]CAF2973840.1 NUPL2 [Lepeophtheirus salmonis]